MIFDGIGLAVGNAESEERAYPSVGFAARAPEILVEIIVEIPSVTFDVQGGDGNEKSRKKSSSILRRIGPGSFRHGKRCPSKVRAIFEGSCSSEMRSLLDHVNPTS